MARFDHGQKLVAIKIVYYGAGLCGKTTNLVALHKEFPADQRGNLLKLDTETERTLFFDFFPAQLGKLGPYGLKADLFTVPGQSFYNATRRAVLMGVDGIVFVADSARDREEANVVAWDNMVDNLKSLERDISKIPVVFQWNKRDTRNPIPVSVLRKQLNRSGGPEFEAVATSGIGVWETQTAVLEGVLADLKARSRAGRVDA